MSRGVVRLLSMMIAGAMAQPTPDMKLVAQLQQYRYLLLTNSKGPIPHRLPNQRQRRKAWRQTPSTRPR